MYLAIRNSIEVVISYQETIVIAYRFIVRFDAIVKARRRHAQTKTKSSECNRGENGGDS